MLNACYFYEAVISFFVIYYKESGIIELYVLVSSTQMINFEEWIILCEEVGSK